MANNFFIKDKHLIFLLSRKNHIFGKGIRTIDNISRCRRPSRNIYPSKRAYSKSPELSVTLIKVTFRYIGIA